MHYQPMEEWLLQHQNRTTIAPPDWADLPDELQQRLENYAQDEAVNRALALAKVGDIYSSDADAIGRLVGDMARVWMLDGDAVRKIVEEFTDELPAPRGEEFDRAVVKIFRRRDTIIWRELQTLVDEGDFLPLIQTVIDYIKLNPERSLDRDALLQLFQKGYDDWVLHTPEAAIDELIGVLEADVEEDEPRVAMQDVHDVFTQRKAINSAHAIELGMDLGVERAVPRELVRFLQRFFELMSKRGELAAGLEYDVLELPEDDLEDVGPVRITAAEEDAPGETVEVDTEPEEAEESGEQPEETETVAEVEADQVEMDAAAEEIELSATEVEREETGEPAEAEETGDEQLEETVEELTDEEEPAEAFPEDDVSPADEEAGEDAEEEVEEDQEPLPGDDEALSEVEEIEAVVEEPEAEDLPDEEAVDAADIVIEEETEDEQLEGSIEVEDAGSFGEEVEAAGDEGEVDIEHVEEVAEKIDAASDVADEPVEEEPQEPSAEEKSPMTKEPDLPDFLAYDERDENGDSYDMPAEGSWWEAQKKKYDSKPSDSSNTGKGGSKAGKGKDADGGKKGLLFWKKK